MPLSFTEKLKLEGKKTLMLYRGRTVETGREFIAYIVCDKEKAVKMYDDYDKSQKVDTIEEYGEVVYVDYIPDPDQKALDFIEEWKKENGFS